jgi:oligosaccharyltransferase complex subunit beta
MRWLFSFLLLWVASTVSALSATGNRLLVILEEAAEKDKYGKFWGDLEGKAAALLLPFYKMYKTYKTSTLLMVWF